MAPTRHVARLDDDLAGDEDVIELPAWTPDFSLRQLIAFPSLR